MLNAIVLFLFILAAAPERNEYADFLSQMKSQQKYGILIFTSKTCVDCVKLEKTLKELHQTKDFDKYYLVCKIDRDKNKILYNRYVAVCQNEAIPLYIVTDGKKLKKFGEGYKNTKDFINWLNDKTPFKWKTPILNKILP
jgi:thioredoxin-related protein